MANFLQSLATAFTPRAKAASSVLSSPGGRGGWWPIVRESFTGAWQRNITVDQGAVVSFHAVFSCMTLIARDVAKLRMKLVAKTSDGVWQETENPAYSPVLRKPNSFQTRNQFWESWMLSKLAWGNAYVLKVRDNRNVVTALFVLDPSRVKPLVAPEGTVYYELATDNMSGLTETLVCPASEIIHDRMNTLFHPLVGISPIYACGLAAMQGLAIQNNATHLFTNASQPGGLLIAPEKIDPDDAKRLKEYWDGNFTGQNAGKIAVLGDGLQYQALTVNPADAQMIEQLKWTAETCCSTFHVPPYKVGIGEMPKYDNIQALNVEYYSQCLQSHIEDIESALDEGLSMGPGFNNAYGTEFDIQNLLRMDGKAQMEMLDKGKNIMKPDEARKMLDLPPVEGGDAVYRQQQEFSLAALAKRDATDDPFKTATPALPAPDPDDEGEAGVDAEQARAMARGYSRAILEAI